MLRLTVIDREGFFVEALATILDAQPQLTTVDSIFGDTTEATLIRLETSSNALQGSDIAIIQHEGSGRVTLDIVRKVLEINPDIAIIMIGMPDSTRLILRYLEEGIVGYIRSSDPLENLLDVVKAFAAQQFTIQPELLQPLLKRLTEYRRLLEGATPLVVKPQALTPRQQEVLELIAKGLSNEDIAERLFIEIGTVKNHVHSILEKTDAENREQAVAYFNLFNDDPDTQYSTAVHANQ